MGKVKPSEAMVHPQVHTRNGSRGKGLVLTGLGSLKTPAKSSLAQALSPMRSQANSGELEVKIENSGTEECIFRARCHIHT